MQFEISLILGLTSFLLTVAHAISPVADADAETLSIPDTISSNMTAPSPFEQ